MARYIDADLLLKDIDESVIFSVRNGKNSPELRGAKKILDQIIKHISTVDVVEVKHGEWNEFDNVCEVEYVCSNCNFSIIEADPDQECAFNYCPNCGAKMDGRKETDK